MAGPSNHTRRLTSLFETITGQSTVTEKQRIDPPGRFAERPKANYIDTGVRDDGLDDAVPEPEQP